MLSSHKIENVAPGQGGERLGKGIPPLFVLRRLDVATFEYPAGALTAIHLEFSNVARVVFREPTEILQIAY